MSNEPEAAPRYAVIYGTSVIEWFSDLRIAYQFAANECEKRRNEKRMRQDLRIAVCLGDDATWDAG